VRVQDYRYLIVWQRAHALAVGIRKATRQRRWSVYGSLRSQLTRAAESVPSNIVEGCYAASEREFARFLDISIKPSGELEYHLLPAGNYGILTPRSWHRLSAETRAVRRMLVALRRRVLLRAAAPRRHSPTDN
jgi:four helix bundle protein